MTAHFIFAQTNQAPEADDQKVSVDANDKVKITLEGKDDDKDDKIKFDIVSDPSHGKLDNFDKSDGTVTYYQKRITREMMDSNLKWLMIKEQKAIRASVEIKVEATNQAPEADDQKVSVDANDKVKITLEGNDDDKDDKIQFDIVSDPSHGKLDNFDKSDGTVTYIPEEDYSGDDEFKFKVVDDKGAESNTGDVEITVKSVTETNQQSATTGDETNQQSATTGDETNQQSATTGDETNQQSATTGDETNQQSATTGDETNQQTATTGDETNQQSATTGDETNQQSATTGDETNQQSATTGDETNQQSATTGDETNQQTTTTGDETNMEAENQTTRQLLKNNESIANNQPPFAYDQDLSIHMNEKADISLTGKDDDNDLIQFAIVSDPTDASLDNFDTTKGTLTFVPKTDYIGNESFAFKVIDDKGSGK